MSLISRLMGEIQMQSTLRDMKPFDKVLTGSALEREENNRAAGSNTDSDANSVSDNTKAANYASTGVKENTTEKKEEVKNTSVEETEVSTTEVNEEAETKADMAGQNASPISGTGTYLDELVRSAGFVSNNSQPQVQQNVPVTNYPNQYPPVQNPAPAYVTQPVNPTDFGRHKVDNQGSVQNQKQPVQKSEADKVNIDLPELVFDVVPPKPPKEWPIDVELPHVEAEPEKIVAVFDNNTVTSKANCRYLKDIEKLALENGCQIQMAEQLNRSGVSTGLINCFVYTTESTNPNPLKCFTIDTGMIIDRRPKMIPVITEFGYEDYPMYYILTPVQDENGKKTKNILNAELFKSIFIGGVKTLNPKDSMYTKDFAELNKRVALITMPTNNMSKDTRKEIQNRLMNAMKAGVFDSVSRNNGAIRFVFAEYNKTDNSFILRSGNVPLNYNSPILSATDKGIHFTFENGAPKARLI